MAGLDKRFPVDFSQLVPSASLVILADDGTQTGLIQLSDIVAMVVELMSGTTNGAGITFSLDGQGHLISHNNGVVMDLGSVIGPKGTDGINGLNGTPGVSVTAAVINAGGHLVFTLSNGATLDAGNLNSGSVALSKGDLIQTLGYTPYDAANPQGFQTATDVQSAISARAPLPPSGVLVSSGAAYQMQPGDHVVAVDKATPSATEIKLPTSPTLWQRYDIADFGNNAGTYNITITFNGVAVDVVERRRLLVIACLQRNEVEVGLMTYRPVKYAQAFKLLPNGTLDLDPAKLPAPTFAPATATDPGVVYFPAGSGILVGNNGAARIDTSDVALVDPQPFTGTLSMSAKFIMGETGQSVTLQQAIDAALPYLKQSLGSVFAPIGGGSTGGTTAPAYALTINTPAAQVAGVNFNLTGTYANGTPTALQWSKNGDTTWYDASSPTISGGSYSFAIALTGTGSRTVTVRDKNNTAVSATSVAFAVSASGTAPAETITVNTPAQQATSTPFAVTGTYANGTPTDLEYDTNNRGAWTRASGATIGGGTYSFQLNLLTAGAYTIQVRDKNNTAAVGATQSFTVVAGSYALSISTPLSQTAGTAFNVTGNYVNGTPSALEVSKDNGATWAAANATIGGGAFSLSVTFTGASSTAKVMVRDAANTGFTATTNAFSVTAAAPAYALAINTPADGFAGDTFTFTGTFTGTAPTSLEYAKDGASTYAAASATIGSGTFSFTLAMSGVGDARTVTVRDPARPMVTATTNAFKVKAVGGGVISSKYSVYTNNGTYDNFPSSGTFNGTDHADVGGYFHVKASDNTTPNKVFSVFTRSNTIVPTTGTAANGSQYIDGRFRDYQQANADSRFGADAWANIAWPYQKGSPVTGTYYMWVNWTDNTGTGWVVLPTAINIAA